MGLAENTRTDMAKKNKKKNTTATQNTVGMGVVPPAGVNSTGMFPPPGGVNSQGMFPPPGGVNSQGMFPPPGGVNSQGVYNMTTTTGIYSTGVVGAPPQPAAPVPETKGKKGKKGKKNKKIPAQAQIDRTKLTAEQLAQLQLEEAVKESTDPSSRLRKLKSPLSVGSCLIMLAIFIVATVLIVFFVCSFMVDDFRPLVIAYDMLDKFGIVNAWNTVVNFFKNLFGGGSGDGGEAARLLLSLLGK